MKNSLIAAGVIVLVEFAGLNDAWAGKEACACRCSGLSGECYVLVDDCLPPGEPAATGETGPNPPAQFTLPFCSEFCGNVGLEPLQPQVGWYPYHYVNGDMKIINGELCSDQVKAIKGLFTDSVALP